MYLRGKVDSPLERHRVLQIDGIRSSIREVAGLLRDSVMHRRALLGKMGNGHSSNLY